MTKRIYLPFIILIALIFVPYSSAKEIKLDNVQAQVYFSPAGGCTEAIVGAIRQAKTKILVQAYSFTSTPIAKALVEARKRGVRPPILRFRI